MSELRERPSGAEERAAVLAALAEGWTLRVAGGVAWLQRLDEVHPQLDQVSTPTFHHLAHAEEVRLFARYGDISEYVPARGRA